MFATREGLYTREDFADDLEHGGGALSAASMLAQADGLALVCPDCQTAEDYVMAEAEAVTSVYAVGDDGRVRQYPKL